MLIISVIIGKNVIYRQIRLTKNGKEFVIYKFRTMENNAETDGAVLADIDDKRITKFGKFLRSLSLDELPQFFNILKGDMSVVGPRPERPEFYRKYAEFVPEFTQRLNVKAGLTGLAQLKGNYHTLPQEKLKFDLEYIENFTFSGDIRIILETVNFVFKRKNI
jgi:lipopolysaccharide/colanic/teichoic acid biosynthesis glycosyltransferase